MAQRRCRFPGPDRYASRIGLAQPSARLFRHSPAVRRADARGATDRVDPPGLAKLAAAAVAPHLLHRARLQDHYSDLADRRTMVLQPAVLAARVRAGFHDVPRAGAWRM